MDDLPAFYAKYVPHDTPSENAWGTMMRDIFRDARNRVLALHDAGRVLDVGCGLGYFLREFEGTSWQATGVDLSADLAERARRDHGVDARAGRLDEQRFLDNSFDAVTLFYVLEHSEDPAAFLREVRRVLRPGGWALIRVPDMEPLIRLRQMFGFPRKFFCPPMHLCDLSPRTLHRMLDQLGFEEIRTTAGGATAPPRRVERWISKLSGRISGALETLSGGTLLLPGVSKTTTAFLRGRAENQAPNGRPLR